MIQTPFFTKRLLLRDFRPSDRARLVHMAMDRRFDSDFFPPWDASKDKIDAAVTAFLGFLPQKNDFRLAVCLRQTGLLIGGVVLKKSQGKAFSASLFIDPAYEDGSYGFEAISESFRRAAGGPRLAERPAPAQIEAASAVFAL